METIAHLIPSVRESVCAMMRIKRVNATDFQTGFVGTAWCIVPSRYLVTAHHVFNGGQAREAGDLFYVFTVPANGPAAYAYPVVGFPVEEAGVDLAIVEVGASAVAGQQIPAVPVTFTRPTDGTPVLTYGFPSPIIAGANLSQEGKFLGGGQFFLKGHANEGIVAAQYEVDGAWHFEFNVGWHHGESGGPVFALEPLAAFAIMQHYRTIQAPHGTVAGPHRGRVLDKISGQLTNLGAMVI